MKKTIPCNASPGIFTKVYKCHPRFHNALIEGYGLTDILKGDLTLSLRINSQSDQRVRHKLPGYD